MVAVVMGVAREVAVARAGCEGGCHHGHVGGGGEGGKGGGEGSGEGGCGCKGSGGRGLVVL